MVINGVKVKNEKYPSRHQYSGSSYFVTSSLFFRDNVLNIFCDASTSNITDKHVNACSGFIAVSANNIIDEFYHCIDDTSSSFAELDALRSAISYAITAGKVYKRVNIFSDYQAGVFGIRNWIGRWRLYNGNIIGSKIIANQQAYLEMAILLADSGMTNIAIYHQKGHIEINCTARTLKQAQNTFLLSNGIPKESADLEFIRYISNWNSYVDKATRQLLSNTEMKNIHYVEPLEFNSNRFDEVQKEIAPILNKIKQNMYLI